jgi:hypothetical protein
MRCKGHLKAEFSTFFHAFNRRGYNIIDPSSAFFDGDDLLLGLCCSERDWAHEQTVTNLPLRFSSSASQGLTLSEFLDSKPPTEAMRRPLLDRHMSFCLDLPSAVPSRPEHGGRLSIGTGGHLVHSPYIPIDCEGRFCAELSYLTRKCVATHVQCDCQPAPRQPSVRLSDPGMCGPDAHKTGIRQRRRSSRHGWSHRSLARTARPCRQ